MKNELNWYSRLLGNYAIMLMMLPAVFTGFFPGQITVITAICGWLFIFLFFKSKLPRTDFDGRHVRDCFLIYMVIVYFRGFGNIIIPSDLYAMFVSGIMVCFLFPMLIYLSQPSMMYHIMKSFITIGILLCIICYYFPPTDGQMSLAHNASFLNVFILAIPFIKRKWSVLIIAGVLFVVLLDVDRRSIMVNNVFSLVIVALWFLLKRFNAYKYLCCILIIIPLVFLYLGLSGSFNVFEALNVIDFQTSQDARNLFVDSRTSIYEDVFNGLKEKGAYIFGLGLNGRVGSSLAFSDDATLDLFRYGRLGSESGMLNYIQYGGIIGSALYSLLLIFAALKATFDSKNDFIKLLGLFIAFKFLYSFIEDKIAFEAHSFYIFLWIGMCYNKKFRYMDNEQMKSYLGLIFK